MKKNEHINFYCVDNDLLSLDSFQKNFHPGYDNFTLNTFNSVQSFLKKLENDTKNKNPKIVFMDNLVFSRGLKTKTALELISPIKNIDKDIAIVIFADSDNLDLNATSSNIKVSAFLKKDMHFFVKLYPLINRLISEYELRKKEKTTKIVTLITLILILVSAIAFGIGITIYS
ncbi:MAG: hypothetical protein LBQ22_10335 [Bacteroidales bacterium]|jgi:DNA-binding NtrC family response regulator|nr:hypothetical protein [Bacteroidales bacterium]